jgi:hypothetical protein
MEYKRAFLFGCSYTSFSYPTWANIMQKDLDIPVYNWGWSGTGNVAIQHRMVQCDLLNKFTEHDLIIPLWSSWTREDRYEEEGWFNVGSVLNQLPESKYDETFVRNHWRWENDVVKNSTAIITANKMFPIWKNFSVAPNQREDQWHTSNRLPFFHFDDDDELSKFYSKHLPDMQMFEHTVDNPLVDDDHPTIVQHLQFVKEHIYSKLNVTIKPSTEQSVHDYHNELQEKLVREKFKRNAKTPYEDYLGIARTLWEKHNFKKHPQFDWNGGSLNPELFK